MRWIRIAAYAAIAASSLWLLDTTCRIPYQCNVTLHGVHARTERAYSGTLPADIASIVARENVERLQLCVSAGFNPVATQMMIAANEQLLARPDAALAAYQTALRYDRRPELFLNMGLILLQQGHREEAIRNIGLAARFNPHVLSTVREVDPTIADLISRQLASQF